MNDSLQWLGGAAPAWLAAAIFTAAIVHAAFALPRRANAASKLTVVILNAACAMALWSFLSPPVRVGSSLDAVLLTEGASQAQIDRAAGAPLAFALPGVALDTAAQRRIARLPDLAALQRKQPGLGRIAVLGAGLTSAQWREAGAWEIAFEPAALPDGFTGVQWPGRLAAGNPLTVTGEVRLSGDGPAQVQLADPSGEVSASATVAAASPQFALEAGMKASGRFKFVLRLVPADGGPATSEPVAVSVYDPPAVRMLMLFSAPSFESRALVRWARRSGASVAVRTAVSLDRFHTAFINRPAVELQVLREAQLSNFDVIIADRRMWQSLAAADRDAVAEAVAGSGLGVLLLVTDAAGAPGEVLPWPPYSNNAGRPVTVELVNGDSGQAGVVNQAAGTVGAARGTLVSDLQGRPVAAWQPHARGELAVTLVTDSYALVTAGHADAHARYWQSLIDAVRKPRPFFGFRSEPRLPMTNWRLQMCVFGTAANATEAAFDGVALALVEQPFEPGQRCGYAWPAKPGWHQFEWRGQHRDVYVYTRQDWQAERQRRSAADTRLAAQRSEAASVQPYLTQSPLPRWWFFLAFSALAALLWLEQKTADIRPPGT